MYKKSHLLKRDLITYHNFLVRVFLSVVSDMILSAKVVREEGLSRTIFPQPARPWGNDLAEKPAEIHGTLCLIRNFVQA